MTGSIYPRPVSPRRIVHWWRQGFALVRRNFAGWLVLMAAFSVLSGLAYPYLPLQLVVSGSGFLCGIALASCVDRARVPDLPEMVRTVAVELPKAGTYAAFATAVSMTGFALVLLLINHGQWRAALDFALAVGRPPLKLYAEGVSVSAVNQFFVVSIGSFIDFTLSLVFPAVMSFFQYPLMRVTGRGWWACMKLGNAGAPSINLNTVAGLVASVIWPTVFVALLVPVAAPIVVAFQSAVCYAAFREIYLGEGENRQLEKASSTSLAGAAG